MIQKEWEKLLEKYLFYGSLTKQQLEESYS